MQDEFEDTASSKRINDAERARRQRIVEDSRHESRIERLPESLAIDQQWIYTRNRSYLATQKRWWNFTAGSYADRTDPPSRCSVRLRC